MKSKPPVSNDGIVFSNAFAGLSVEESETESQPVESSPIAYLTAFTCKSRSSKAEQLPLPPPLVELR